MTPSAEQLEHLQIAQRASLRNAQTFNIYIALVVGGKRHDEALKEAEAAIEAWSEYEDAHAIEPPPMPSINDVLSKIGGMADGFNQRRTDAEASNLVIEMANALEECVVVLEREGKRSKGNKLLISRVCALVTRADTPSAPASTDPPGQVNGGLPQSPDISTEKENV